MGFQETAATLLGGVPGAAASGALDGVLEPDVMRFDPTPENIKPVQGGIADFLQGVFQGETASPFGGMASPLQQQATGGIAQFLGQQSPEQQVFRQMAPQLAQQAEGGTQFTELQNPFGAMGAPQQARATVKAAQPIFQENLSNALTTLGAQAPSIRNTAFAQQAGETTQRALQDFNLFAQQALQQGQQLQQRGRESALNFLTGARGLQQQATAQAGQQGLQAAGTLGQLAGQAGQAPFNRLLGAGQFGLQTAQQQIDPTLRLMLGGMQFAHPSPIETIVGPSGAQQFGDLMGGLGPLAMMAASAASSAVFKEDIEPLTETDDARHTEDITDMNLYRYRYKGDSRQRVGAIVEDAPPSITNGPMVDLYEMMSKMLSSMKDLKRRIEQLEEAA